MLITYRNGQGGVILRIKIADKTRDDGGGLPGLDHTTAGLVISTIADNESTSTAYRSATSTLETIATLGTYQAPTDGKCRFREVDPVNHRGVYEVQLSDARFSVNGAKSILIAIYGAANAMDCDALIPLTIWNPYASNGGFDPWSVDLPSSYPANSAGRRLGFLDVAVSTRSTFAGGAVASVTGAVASVTAPVVVGTIQDKSGYQLAATGLDSVLVEPGINARQALSPILAALAGTVSGAETGTILMQGGNSTTTRITATTDSSGNRSSVTLVLPT